MTRTNDLVDDRAGPLRGWWSWLRYSSRPARWWMLHKARRTQRMLTRMLKENEQWLAEREVRQRQRDARTREFDAQWRRVRAQLDGQLELWPNDPESPPPRR
jgi:hypothetical protein